MKRRKLGELDGKMKVNKELLKFFKALGNERRLKIVGILIEISSLTIEDIAKRIALSYKSTSKHLLMLEDVGILKRKRRVNSIVYFIRYDVKQKLRRLIKVALEI